MPVIHNSSGSTTIVGKTSIDFFRLATLKAGLQFEVRTGGMKITRGPTCYARIKREFGFKGNRASVLQQFTAYVDAMRTQVEHVIED
jgi:hypothetical protein